MPRITENFRDAQTLVKFSYLEPKGVNYFRNNFSDFVPDAWWDYQAHNEEEKQWQTTQKVLQKVWENRFQDGSTWVLVDFLRLIFNPDNLFAALIERKLRQSWPDGVPEDVEVDFSRGSIKCSDVELTFRPLSQYGDEQPSRRQRIPMQKAITYLFDEPWRMRFCAECKKRFVAAASKSKFCSEKCANGESRLKQKQASWHKHKAEWRPARKKRKG